MATASLIWIAGPLTASPVWSETQAEESLTVSIAAPAYWCPYACDVAELQWGFAVDIARAALESVGHEVVYRNLSYDRALLEARSGRVDTTMPTFKGEAPGFVFPRYAVSLTEFCFFISEDEPWRYAGLDSLESIRFVATSGYSYGESVDAYISANLGQDVMLIGGYDIPARLHNLVRMGRFDALLDDRLLFEFSQSSTGLVNAGCLEERHKGYLALSPKHPDRSNAIAEAFDRGFERIREDGQLCTILDNYELDPHFVPSLNQEDCRQ